MTNNKYLVFPESNRIHSVDVFKETAEHNYGNDRFSPEWRTIEKLKEKTGAETFNDKPGDKTKCKVCFDN